MDSTRADMTQACLLYTSLLFACDFDYERGGGGAGHAAFRSGQPGSEGVLWYVGRHGCGCLLYTSSPLQHPVLSALLA